MSTVATEEATASDDINVIEGDVNPNTTAPAAATSMLAEEENYPEPETLQEELNEILTAFYEVVSEDDIQAYQRSVEDIQGQRIAEQALMEPSMAPTFDLVDQDGDPVSLTTLLEKGPVVLTFYRGKWCPHCNATLMRYGTKLVPLLERYQASLVAISPMLADGTAFLASKRDLRFPVCSDFDNTLANAFNITFTVQPHSRPYFQNWGEDVPLHNGVETWDIPLPATYVIAPTGQIAWSFVDNDPGIRAEVEEIIEQVAKVATNPLSVVEEEPELPTPPRHSAKTSRRKLFNRKRSTTFSFGANAKFPKFFCARTHSDPVTAQDLDLFDAMADLSEHTTSSVRSEGNHLLRSKNKPRRKKYVRTVSAQKFLEKYMIR